MMAIRQLPLTVHNVALRLNRSERTVRNWAEIGKLRGFKIDKKSWLFTPEYIEVWQALHPEATKPRPSPVVCKGDTNHQRVKASPCWQYVEFANSPTQQQESKK
jgi:Helix-turn-helix domain